MRPKLYLESTIPSYLVARPSQAVVVAGQQLTTHQWWAKRLKDFDIYVSQVVLEEISAGDEEMARQRLELVKSFAELRLTDEVNVLTKALLRRGPLPPKAARDAAHIAVATVHGMHFLLTWNCRHIANAELHRAIRRVVEQYGYEVPSLCTPEELMGEEQ